MKIQVGKKELSEKQKKILRKVKVILQYVFIFLSLLIATTVAWVFRTWKGLTMEEVVFQIQAPTTGTDSGIISSFILTCPLISIVLTLVILLLHKRLGKIKDIAVLGLMVAFLAVAAFSVGYMWNRLDITAYAKNQTTESTFIEDNYADPKEVELTFPEKKRNLIYIFLESFEQTFASAEYGGFQEENLIPNLTKLQQEKGSTYFSEPGGYGMTEMASTVTALLPEDHLRDGGKYLSSVGRPIPGAAVRIVAPDGSDCPAGTAGEIYVRGPGRMLEYLDAPETTHAALVGGWYRTKDMGMLDAQGYLFLSGRADDLIISGGENIYPGEVTNVIMQLCDDVAEVAVYGVPDETWGEHVKASVVLMPGSRLTAEALRQYCRAHMPTFRAPKEIEIVPELPKGATGKVLTAVLRARSVQAS